MHQRELELLLMQLAQAEQAAAEEIAASRKVKEANLETLRNELLYKQQQALGQLELQLKSERDTEQQEIERSTEKGLRECEKVMQGMEKKFESEREEMIVWAVERIRNHAG